MLVAATGIAHEPKIGTADIIKNVTINAAKIIRIVVKRLKIKANDDFNVK